MGNAPIVERKPRAKKSKTDDLSVVFTVDGTTYPVAAGEISAVDELELMRETGMTFTTILAEPSNFGLVSIGALMWISRRQNGDDVALRDVLASVTFMSEVEFDEGKASSGRSGPVAI